MQMRPRRRVRRAPRQRASGWRSAAALRSMSSAAFRRASEGAGISRAANRARNRLARRAGGSFSSPSHSMLSARTIPCPSSSASASSNSWVSPARRARRPAVAPAPGHRSRNSGSTLSRRNERSKPVSRLEGSSTKVAPLFSSQALSSCRGTSSNGRSSHPSPQRRLSRIPARPLTPAPRNMRSSSVSHWSSWWCAVSRHSPGSINLPMA